MPFIAVAVIDASVNPWLLIPVVIMTVLFYYVRRTYINVGRSLRRIEALSELINPICA